MSVLQRSGQLVQATKRVQIGIEVQPLNGIAGFRDVPKPSLLVPVFWAEEVRSTETITVLLLAAILDINCCDCNFWRQ